MARERKYAGLPDMDDGQDIYETPLPELTDDTSTVPTTAKGGNHSDDEFYDLEDPEDPISRSRLRMNDALSRFQTSNVNTDSVDFTDRVDGKRKSYKVSSRRQKVRANGTVEYGDLSDEDDDEEGLERKIARLKREVEEAKEELAKRATVAGAEDGEKKPTKAGDGEKPTMRLESMSEVLQELSRSAAQPGPLPKATPAPAGPADESAMGSNATYTLTYAPTYEESHALAKTADFDRRLLSLEKGLGIASTIMPEVGSDGLPRAILPSLDVMEKQIATLAQASGPSLRAITSEVEELAKKQKALNDARDKDKSLGEGGRPAESDAKINALYGILPTIESLSPMLPPLLDRLRSLRAIHADAASASETLERLEKDQAEMAAELKQWRVGLEKMEEAIKGGDETVQGNMKVMEGWVKGLEERMDKLK